MFKSCLMLSSLTVLYDDNKNINNDAFIDWLDNAGRDASSRTLTLKSKDAYKDIFYYLLPMDWDPWFGTTTLLDVNGNVIEPIN